MGKKKSKGVKVDLGSFLGRHAGGELGHLPTAPEERGDDDDGRFQRGGYRDKEDFDAPQGKCTARLGSRSRPLAADLRRVAFRAQPVTSTLNGAGALRRGLRRRAQL